MMDNQAKCPFAAIENDEKIADTDVSIMKNHPPIDGTTDMHEQLRRCPAFSSAGGCPFKNRGGSDAMVKALEKCPAFREAPSLGDGTSEGSEKMGLSCPFKRQEMWERVRESQWDVLMIAADAFISGDEVRRLFMETSPPIAFSQEEKATTAAELSRRLKSGTEVAHALAESTDFVRRFTRGDLTAKSYSLLLLSLQPVYDTLESCLRDHALDEADNPEGSSSVAIMSSLHRALERTQALEEDINFFASSLPDPKPELRAADAYAQRIKEISKTRPYLLIAHAYTRYLGDLSGGQVLKRLTRRALGMPRNGDEGTLFYSFEPHIAKSEYNSFKQKYRNTLNSLPLTDAQMQEMVNEADFAFRLNVDVFAELDQLCPPPLGQSANDSNHTSPSPIETVKMQPDVPVETPNNTTKPPAICPFAKMAAEGGIPAAALPSGHPTLKNASAVRKSVGDRLQQPAIVVMMIIALIFLVFACLVVA